VKASCACEQVQSYTLTLQVRNAPDLVAEAQLNIKVKDENNKSPVFTNIDSGQDTAIYRKIIGTEQRRLYKLC